MVLSELTSDIKFVNMFAKDVIQILLSIHQPFLLL
jgi:hypothetical protein